MKTKRAKLRTSTFSLLLILSMLLTFLPVTAAAAESSALSPDGAFTYNGRSLSLEGEIFVNQYVLITGFEEFTSAQIEEKGGLLVWTSEVTDETALFGTQAYVSEGMAYNGLYEGTPEYMVCTKGIAAKCYADELYFRPYIEVADGVYAYGPVDMYSVQTYCYNQLDKADAKDTLKETCAALLHYGTAAQTYFGYNTSDPANAQILETWPAEDWDATLLTALESGTTSLEASASVIDTGKSLSLEGEILVNYYFQFSGTAAKAELLFWDGVSGELNEENVSCTKELAAVGGEYTAQSNGFSAKSYGKTVFTCAKFTDTEGNVHYGPLVGYSPEYYAQRQIDKDQTPLLVELVKRMVIYGEKARIYFGGSVNTDSNVTTDRIEVNNGEGAQATVPAGVKLNPGVSELTLSVVEMEQSGADITTAETEETVSFDVHIDGIASDNGKAIIVDLGPVMPLGLNMGNYRLYHVEDGVTNQMTMVNSLDELDAHNEFFYDPATGNLTVAMATFSEVALVSDTENAWKGEYDYNWYDASAKSYTIANADQLAAFGAIVGGMADGVAQDDFAGKTVTLLADIDLGGAEDTRVEGETPIFYPIGYYNSIGSYEKQPDVSVTSGVSSFEGIFDGQGHTIKNFYQNTWEMFGDYNNGYSGTPNHYKDAMGLFGYVYNGTVKNLNVANFSSDGEFTPTGVIAAYACNATFENIAITDCNPRVYNTGNGGIVGIGGNDSDTEDMKLTFSNITIDNSNKITALWGSWDVACGGLVGMFRGAGHVYMDSCHVAAQLDVYNDVCGNYQYYWYRYAGMMVGTNKTMVTDANGYTVPETSKYHASDCTVHFGEWNDYYYCELVANSLASYTHDHQFSRLTLIASLDEIKGGETWTKTGNFLFEGECYHIVSKDGELVRHFHEDAGTETVNGETVLKENNQIVYLPFNQLFTGYGWGVKHIPVGDFSGITILDREVADSVEKFAKADGAKDAYTSGHTVTVGELFQAAAIADPKLAIKGDQVQVSVSPADDTSTASGVYTANTDDWTQGTVSFVGLGNAVITISDYYFCTPTTINVELTAINAADLFLYSAADPKAADDLTKVPLSWPKPAPAV